MERYPQLQSQQRFADLMVALEGTENRIRTQRRDYNEAVRQFNTTIRTFPDAIGAKIFYGAEPKVRGDEEAPTGDFNTAGCSSFPRKREPSCAQSGPPLPRR